MAKPTRSERVVFLGDTHFGYQDQRAIDIALDVTRETKPDAVYLIGDILDAEELGKYDGDPENPDFESEITTGRAFLETLRDLCKQANITWLDGNHEYRLDRHNWQLPRHARRRLTIPNLLGLGDLGIRYRSYEKGAVYHTKHFVVEHGDRVSKHSSYTAKNMLEARGISGISGHTHRLGVCHRRDYSGHHEWYENGCLRDLDPSWTKSRPNWQQGFHVGLFRGQKSFQMEQLKIKDGDLFYGGRWL